MGSGTELSVHPGVDHPGGRRGEPQPGVVHGDVERALDREREVVLLRDAMMELHGHERLSLALYYFDEIELHEIASALEATEFSVSEIRSSAIARMRARVPFLSAKEVA